MKIKHLVSSSKFSAFIGDDGNCGVGAAILYNIRMDLVKPNDIILIAAPNYQQVLLDEVRTCFYSVLSDGGKLTSIDNWILDCAIGESRKGDY